MSCIGEPESLNDSHELRLTGKSRAEATKVALGLDDGAVSGNELTSSEEGGGDEDGGNHFDGGELLKSVKSRWCCGGRRLWGDSQNRVLSCK